MIRTRTIKTIKVNADKCTGCRACEVACAAYHAEPKYSIVNPARSRIRICVDEIKDVYVPVFGGNYARAECSGRNHYNINGKEYSECAFCRASCPSRSWFKEPDSRLPLKCDMCEATPPLPQPMCVQACKFGALTYEEREEEIAVDSSPQDEIDTGLEALTNRYGLQKVIETLARMSGKR